MQEDAPIPPKNKEKRAANTAKSYVTSILRKCVNCLV